MGKLLRKAKKAARTNEPLFALKEIQALYNERNKPSFSVKDLTSTPKKNKMLDLNGIAYAIHMSNCTLSKLVAQNSSIIAVLDEYTSKEKKVLSKALHDSYLSLKKPSEDKIDKFRKIADLKAKEQNGQKMTMKSYNLVPMNFCEQKKSIFLFENFRWLYDVLGKKDIKLSTFLKESDFSRLWTGMFPAENDNLLWNLFDEMDGDPGDDIEKDLVSVYYRINNYRADTMTPEWSYFFSIVGYLLGINSTFLEGKNVHPILFNGVGGVDFRVEHIRMKLIWMYDNEEYQSSSTLNIPTLYKLIVNPYEDPEMLKSYCEDNKINIKALQGMPQQLLLDERDSDRNSTWSTMKFKSILRNSDKFIMKV